MSARATITGLDVLMRELADTPASIRGEAMAIVHETTESAASDLRAAYGQHSVTGTLASRVRASYPATDEPIGIIQSMAPHSHLFEWGTKQRKNAAGVNRGVMPEAKILPPLAQRWREWMTTRLMAMLASRGFLVSRT